MAIRTYWVEAYVEGRATPLAGGPRSREGEMSVKVLQRQNGTITTAIRVECWPLRDGRLRTEVLDRDGRVVFEFVTDY